VTRPTSGILATPLYDKICAVADADSYAALPVAVNAPSRRIDLGARCSGTQVQYRHVLAADFPYSVKDTLFLGPS